MHASRGSQNVVHSMKNAPSFYRLQIDNQQRSVVVPRPGVASPNLVSGLYRAETGPVEMEVDVQPVALEFGTGGEPTRRGKPLLYGLRSMSNNNTEVLIPESRPEDLGKKKVTDGGGADFPAPVISAEVNPSTPDREVSAARVNAVAFGDQAVKADPEKIYVAPADGPTVLGTAHFHRFMGNNYRADARWGDAIGEYNQVLAVCPGDDLVRAYRAEAKWMAGQRDDAAQDYKALRRSSNAEVRFIRANWLRETGRSDEAIKEYESSLAKAPTVKAWNNLGVAYMNNGDTAKAADAFGKALEADPDYDKALLNMGILQDDLMGNPQAALPYYERYLKNPRAVRRGEVARWANDAKKAIKE